MTVPLSPQQIASRPPVPGMPNAQSPERTRAAGPSPGGQQMPLPQPEPLMPPPPPIEEVRGKQYPDEDASDGQKVEFLKKVSSDNDTGFIARAKTMSYNLLMAAGKQHISWSTRTKRFEALPLDPNETRVTVNYIRPILRARTNRLLPTRLDWQIVPDSNDYDARDMAEVGERWLDYMTERTQLLQKTDLALELSYCGGVSFLKSFWNGAIGEPKAATQMQVELTEVPVLNPDTGEPVTREDGSPVLQVEPQAVERFVNSAGEVVENEQDAHWFRSGDTDIALRSLFNVRWNPDAQGFTAGEGLRWVVDEDRIPVEVARERYPEIAKKIVADGDNTALGTYESLARDANLRSPEARTTGGSRNRTNTGETVRVVEYWELPSPYFEAGRCMVMVGNVLAYDGDYPDGVFPYDPIYDEPAALSPGGRGVVLDLTGPQSIINELYGSHVAAARMSGLGQFLTFNFPGVPELVTHQHGAVLRLPRRMMAGNRNPAELFRPLEHPPLPADRFQLLEFCRQTMYQLGAFHEVTRGQVPPGVTSGVAVRALSEREDGMLKRASDALRTSLVRVARTQLAIARIKDDPDSTRWLPVDRPDLGYQIQQASGAKLPDPERIRLTLEGFKPRNEAEMRADTMEALQAGLIAPQTALKVFDLGRGVKGVHQSEQRHYAKARAINLAIEEGRVQLGPLTDENGQPIFDPDTQEPLLQSQWVTVGDGTAQPEPCVLASIDDHVTHLSVLQELALDTSKPFKARQLATGLFEERLQTLRAGAAPAPKPDSDPASGNDPNTP